MIDFRFLLTTIVAVFLALAIGLLIGSGLLADALERDLERQVEGLLDRNNELRDRNLEQSDLIEAMDTFGLEIEPELVDGELSGDQIVLIRFEGTSTELLDRVEAGIELADASIATTITITDRMAMTDQGAVDQLLSTFRPVFAAEEEDPSVMIGHEIGARAASDSEGRTEEASFGGIQDDLVDNGFIEVETDRAVPIPSGADFVVAAGSDGDPPYDVMPFAEALLAELTQGPEVVAVEGWQSAWNFVPDLRGSDVRDDVSTVDHGDTVPGTVSVVFELDRLPADEPEHFGFREGSDGIAPDLLPSD